MYLFYFFYTIFFACSTNEGDSGTSEKQNTSYDFIAGVYDVTQVTCSGEVVPISVSAQVTFENNNYLEEWSFPQSECKMSLEGTTNVEDDRLTILDVELSCNDSCETDGITCHDAPCSVDQIYQYNFDENDMIMSFTQQGDEFSCGPCGNGIESTYTLSRITE